MTTDEAIKAFGGIKPLADALGIWPTAIYQWGECVPVRRQEQIEAILQERETQEDSRADDC